MANIDLLYPGCTGQQIIDTINALIAALNSGQGQTISYNDLDDKPIINGIEVKGELTTAALKIKFSETTDFDIWETTLATKAYADEIGNGAVEAAEAAVQADLDGKLDKDLGNMEVVSSIGENDCVLLVTSDGLRIVKVNRLSDNVAVRTVSTRVLESSINTQLRELTVVGSQNGENTNFTVAEAYVAGTQMLFFNGQMLTRNTDYTVTAAGFTMITQIPTAADKIIFLAVPK